MIKTGASNSIECEQKMRKFSNGYSNAIYHSSSFAHQDEPTKAAQKFYPVKKKPQQKGKMINFTGDIKALHDSHNTIASNYHTPTVNPSKEIDVNSVPTVSSVFQPIYHMTNLNEVCLLSDNLRENLHACFSNDNCRISDTHSSANSGDTTEWYNEVDINSIRLVGYYKPMSIDNEVYNEVGLFDVPNEATVQHNNFQTLFKIEDP